MDILPGTDIIEIHRIKESIETLGEAFLTRIFTKDEIEYCEGKKASKYQSYGARFAAKEAVSKAFGTGIGIISFTEIEIYNDSNGAPKIRLNGNAEKLAKELKILDFTISLSHCKEYAVAFVLATKKRESV